MNPTIAENSRALLRARGFGILATHSKRSAGFPFVSVVTYALDAKGRPVFLLSRLAVHTQNLLQDARASLLVCADGFENDPLNSARLTVLGELSALAEAETAVTRELYLARRPEAAQWIGFGDFALYRMEIAEAYYVGGFGVMGWVTGASEFFP